MLQTKLKFLFIFLFLLSFFQVAMVSAADINYTVLAPIPGLCGNGNGDCTYPIASNGSSLALYLNNVYKIGIALCVGFAVIMIIWGGMQYLSSDAVGNKEEGKKRIWAAVIGLMIALGSWLILYTLGGDKILNLNLELKPLNISAIYVKLYDQWTNADDKALSNPNSPDYQAALKKWNDMQAQANALKNTYGSQVDPTTANVGPANQKVLAEINKGDCSQGTNCFTSAVALGNNAGVTFNSVFQNKNYIVGGQTLSSFGSARQPVPGEMVDMYTGYNSTDPFHSVIIYSSEGNGKYVVWDWHHNTATGLRTVNLNLDQPGTNGYIGRIYTPQVK